MKTKILIIILVAFVLLFGAFASANAQSVDSVTVHTWHIVSKTSREFSITKHPTLYRDSIMISQFFKMGKNYRVLVGSYTMLDDCNHRNIYLIVANPPVLTDDQKRRAFVLY